MKEQTEAQPQQAELQRHSPLPSQPLDQGDGDHDSWKFCQRRPEEVAVVHSVERGALSRAAQLQSAVQGANVVAGTLEELCRHEDDAVIDEAATEKNWVKLEIELPNQRFSK